MYFDLNIPWTPENIPFIPKELAALEKLGYHAVSINHRVEGKLPKTRCPFGKISYKSEKSFTNSLHQYSRLTLILSDPQQNYGINNINNEIISSYDIIAVQPETEKMFQSACTNLEIDILSLDLTGRISFPIKPGYLRQALQRGVALEICYSPLIADATARRNIVGNLRMLIRYIGALVNRNKAGIILSSGAEGTWQLRAPEDVISLAGFLGIPAHIRKSCVESGCEAVFMHAASRKLSFRTAITVLPTEKEVLNEQEDTTTDMQTDFIEFK